MSVDLCGEWIFNWHPWDLRHPGRVGIQLQKVCATLSGELLPLIDSRSGQAQAKPQTTEATVAGEMLETAQTGNCLVILKRLNQQHITFAGVLSDAHRSISATVANTVRNGGSI